MKRTEIRTARIFHAKTHLVAQSGVFQMVNNQPFSLEGRMETGCKSILLDQVDRKNGGKILNSNRLVNNDIEHLHYGIIMIVLGSNPH